MRLSVQSWILGMTICLAAVATSARAQEEAPKKFFIYIQNQAGGPFYVRSGDSVLSSTPSGYLILPGLKKGDYKLTIGFPRNQAPEASFDIDLDGSGDKGFLLQKGEQGALNLYAMKDFKAVAPAAVASAPGNRIVDIPEESEHPARKRSKVAKVSHEPPAEAPAPTVAQTGAADSLSGSSPAPADDSDAFSRMLNEITGTKTSAKPAPAAAASDVPAPTTQAVSGTPAGTDTGLSEATESDVPAAADNKTDSGASPTVAAEPQAARPAPSAQEPEFITFPADSTGSPVAVPVATNTDSATIGALDTASAEPEEADSAAQARKEERKLRRAERRAEKAREDSVSGSQTEVASDTPDVSAPAAETAPEAETASVPATESKPDASGKKPLSVNSDCQHLASSEDFQKMRRKMASRSDEDGMFRIAGKYLAGGDCFSVAQIQSLTYLFLTDEYKYKFLELAYPHTYDPTHFPGLEKTLGSDYYRKRFEAMVR